MQVQAIGNTAAAALTSPVDNKTTGGANFGDILSDAIKNAQDAEATDQQGTLALLAGAGRGNTHHADRIAEGGTGLEPGHPDPQQGHRRL